MIWRSLFSGWSIWCPRAGQLFEWGISPEGESGSSGFDDSWLYSEKELETDYVEEEALPPNITVSDVCVVVRSMPTLMLPVWVGVTLYWIREMGRKEGLLSDGNRVLSVFLSEKAESCIRESEASLSHSVKATSRLKCSKCPYGFFCQFLREVAYDESGK